MNTLNREEADLRSEQLFNAYSVMFYFAGSIVTLEPEEDGLPGFCSSGLLRNLPVKSINPVFATATEFFRTPCDYNNTCCENVNDHYQKLFSDKDNSSAWPAESAWPSPMDTILCKVHGTINEFYTKYSFNPDNDRFLPADHLGIELLFLNKLISAYLNEKEPVSKGNIRRDITSFINSHLLNWLPGWVKAVNENSGTKCFKGVAHLILASVEDVKSLLVR
jgi:TorA maturation chaperone TorD